MPKRLRAEGVRIQYGPDAPPVLAGFTLAVRPGALIGVVGPNGSGKSTLIRALSRALRPSAGAVLLDGADLYTATTARESAQAVAVLPQDTQVSLDFSAREVVRMGRSPHLSGRPFAGETAGDERAVSRALDAAGIRHLADRPITSLSGGERQRVLLARALAQEPDVLLLDEPTAHLDLRHQGEALALAQRLAHDGGKAVLAVLHDLTLAGDCDEVVLLCGGEIAAQGKPSDVLTRTHLERVYGARVWVRPSPLSGRPLVLSLPFLPPAGESGAPHVHVTCGGGSGTGLLFALRRRGYRVSAGALGAGDPDADAADALGIPFARAAPFSPLGPEALAEAARLASGANAVVVSSVAFGPDNLAVLEAALAQRRAGTLLVCVQGPGGDFGGRDWTGGAAARLWADLQAAGATLAPDDEAALALLEGLSRGSADGTRD